MSKRVAGWENVMGKILADLRDDLLKRQKQSKNTYKASQSKQSEESDSE